MRGKQLIGQYENEKIKSWKDKDKDRFKYLYFSLFSHQIGFTLSDAAYSVQQPI